MSFYVANKLVSIFDSINKPDVLFQENQIQRKLWLLFANQPLVKTALMSCTAVPLNVYLSSCLTIVGLTLGQFTGNMDSVRITYLVQTYNLLLTVILLRIFFFSNEKVNTVYR